MLNTISQRIRMPGCTSETDIPLYHNWLTSQRADHTTQLKQWYEPFAPIIQIARTVLEMVRNSATFVPETAKDGWFEQGLDPGRIHQMIRIRMPAESEFYPEISIGKTFFQHRIPRGRRSGPAARPNRPRSQVRVGLLPVLGHH